MAVACTDSRLERPHADISLPRALPVDFLVHKAPEQLFLELSLRERLDIALDFGNLLLLATLLILLPLFGPSEKFVGLPGKRGEIESDFVLADDLPAHRKRTGARRALGVIEIDRHLIGRAFTSLDQPREMTAVNVRDRHDVPRLVVVVASPEGVRAWQVEKPHLYLLAEVRRMH